MLQAKKAQVCSEAGLSKLSKQEIKFSVAVVHSNAPQLGKRVAEELKKRMGLEVSMVLNATPVLGAHAGPGAVAVAFLPLWG